MAKKTKAYAKLVRKYGRVPSSEIVKAQLETIQTQVFTEEILEELEEERKKWTI